jgi:3-keto-disaccharide hydrolase
MFRTLTWIGLTLISAAAAVAQPNFAPVEETGFQPIFDGQSLKGWDCDPDFFRVEGEAIVGETAADKQPKQNIFCIWREGQPADFELRLQYRLSGGPGGNSGIQYRSADRPDVAKWVLQGYQADIDAAQRYTGMLYEERGRGFINRRGLVTSIGESKKSGLVASIGDDATLKTYIKTDDWNDFQVIARGNVLVHIINGHVMSMFIDDDKENRKASGLIGIQLHVTKGPMKIEVRNIRIKTL